MLLSTGRTLTGMLSLVLDIAFQNRPGLTGESTEEKKNDQRSRKHNFDERLKRIYIFLV